MTTPIEEMIDKDTVIRAAGKMRDLNLGALPVKTDEHRLHGFISDRDIVVCAIAEGKDPETTRISEIMSKGIISCTADQTPEEAAAIMADAQVRRLIVADKEDKVLGIISLGDLAVEGTDKETAGEAVKEISRPAAPSLSRSWSGKCKKQ